MGVVHVFGAVKRAEGEDSSKNSVNHEDNDNITGEVVQLVINKRIAHGVPPSTVYRQIEALLVTHGVDFSCPKIRSDYKIITYLVQGMMDRSGGQTSDRCMLLDTLRHTLAYEVPSDTEEVFGDLLGRLD